MQLVSSMKRDMKSQAALVLVRKGVARLLDLSSREHGTLGLWDGYHEPALADECDRNWRRLDLDATVTPANFKRHSRLQAGLLADLFRDDKASRRIYGSFHTMKCTIIVGMRTTPAMAKQCPVVSM